MNSAALTGRVDKILGVKMRYKEGIMTRLEWLEMRFKDGAYVCEGTRARIQYNRIKFNRMSSYKEQEEYMKKCNERVLCYELHLPGTTVFWEITKTEYDAFLAL